MSSELLEQAKMVVQKAEKLGAQGVRASLGRTRDSEVEWRDGKVDRLRESTSMGMGVTLYVDGRYSSNSTSDLRPEAIDKFLQDTVAMTKILARDPHRKLPDPERYQGRFSGDLNIFDSDVSGSVTAVERRKTAQSLEEAARSAEGSDKIISVTSSCSDSVSDSAMVTSNGMEGTRRTSTFFLFAETSVRGEGDRKPEGYWYSVTRHKDKLDSIEEVGNHATRRALAGLGAKPEKSGEYACVVENRVLRRLLGGLQDPLSGSAIQQKRSFLADKMGQQVLSPLLTITDHPHVITGLGSCTYDSEGMATIKRPVFDRGVLKSFFLDTYYASKLEMEPTIGSPTNIVFDLGQKDLDGLIAAMGEGIYITGFIGGNSNSATGDFSYGIRGHWVEGGKLVRPVSEMNIAGNHLTFWKKLAEVGNDPYLCSSLRCPSLRFDEVQFSGA